MGRYTLCKAPIGDLRWMAPRKLDASASNIIQPQKNNFCVQEPSGLGGSNIDGFFLARRLFVFRYQETEKVFENPLPVMFWIHGGGNTTE